MIEPIGVPVIRWRCAVPACPKSYADRSRAREHAAICPRDPDNRSCLTCVNYYAGSRGYGMEDPGEDRACALGLNVEPPLPRQCPSWAGSSLEDEKPR